MSWKYAPATGLAVAALAIAGCGGGGSSATGASSPAQRPAGGAFASLTAAQRSCLEKQGVTPPSGQRRPPNGTPPSGGSGGGGRPGGGQRDPARFAKMQAAFKKCGVTLPARPPGGGPPGQTGTTANN